jgi:hypothetical protein
MSNIFLKRLVMSDLISLIKALLVTIKPCKSDALPPESNVTRFRIAKGRTKF